MSAQPVDVLAALANAITFARAYNLPNSAADYEAAHAAVTELIEAANVAERIIYRLNGSDDLPGFASSAVVNLRAALARVQGGA